jgi:hypothetical protein
MLLHRWRLRLTRLMASVTMTIVVFNVLMLIRTGNGAGGTTMLLHRCRLRLTRLMASVTMTSVV